MTQQTTRTTPVGDIDWTNAPAWYDANAEAFAQGSAAADTSAILDLFCAGLRPGAHVLDLGCGAGRDAAALLERGYSVTAVDASAAMCAHARRATGGRAQVSQANFAVCPAPDERWDGIWMMAALLHLPKAEWSQMIGRLHAALAPRGHLYVSIKQGRGELIDSRGRPMSLAEPGELLGLAMDAAPAARIRSWTSRSAASGGEMQDWSNLLLVAEATK